MTRRVKSLGRTRTGAWIVTAVLAVGLAWRMASEAPALMSTASAAALPTPIAQAIGTDAAAPTEGNPLGAVTVAEFFDYRCPYCRIMEPRIAALIARDHRVRLVLKEWPIFGGPSVTAARIALAASWQGKFAAVHQAFFNLPRTMDEAAIRAAAAVAGVDMARLDSDMASRGGEIDAELARADKEAHAIGLQGTPGLVIGTLIAPGALPPEELDKLVSRAAGT